MRRLRSKRLRWLLQVVELAQIAPLSSHEQGWSFAPGQADPLCLSQCRFSFVIIGRSTRDAGAIKTYIEDAATPSDVGLGDCRWRGWHRQHHRRHCDCHSRAMTQLILKRASASRPSGEWDDDFGVLANGEVVGRIFKANAAPVGSPWMWTILVIGDRITCSRTATRATREDAMAAFAKGWRRE
jgi:hypothetical protein